MTQRCVNCGSFVEEDSENGHKIGKCDNCGREFIIW